MALEKLPVAKIILSGCFFSAHFLQTKAKCFLALLDICEDKKHKTPYFLGFKALLLNAQQWTLNMGIPWELVKMQNLGLPSSLLQQYLHFHKIIVLLVHIKD